MIIIVEGNIGAGKSEFITKLCEKLKCLNLKVKYIAEPVDKWVNFYDENILQLFYENQERWAFTFQTLVLTDVTLNELEASKYSDSGYIVIMERSTFSVRELFIPLLCENKIIQPIEFNILNSFVNIFPKHLKNRVSSIITIYIRTEPNVCYERLLKRARPEEMNRINLNYIEKLHDIHEEKLSVDNIPYELLIVDSEKYDLNSILQTSFWNRCHVQSE